MSTQKHLATDKLVVYNEAKIKHLYVEDLQTPKKNNTIIDPHPILETAENDKCASLVNSRGKTGKETAKVKGLKSGVGININSFERVLEIKSNLSNKSGLHTKILDINSQTLKQLKAGRGIVLDDDGEVISLASDLVQKDIRTENLLLTNFEDCIKINSKALRGTDGIAIKETDTQYIIANTQKIFEKITKEKDCVSLLDGSGLNRLQFPSEFFKLSVQGPVTSITPTFVVQNSKSEGCKLSSNNILKTIKADGGIRITETEDCLSISSIQQNILNELKRLLSTSSLKFEIKNGKFLIDKEEDILKSTGLGTTLLSSDNKVKSIVGTGATKVYAKSDVICIHSDPILSSFNVRGGANLLFNGRLKCLTAGANIQIHEKDDCAQISCPITLHPAAFKLVEEEDGKICVKGIETSGALKAKIINNTLQLHVNDLSAQESSHGVMRKGKFRDIKAGENVDIKYTDSSIQISSVFEQKTHTSGHKLLDSNNILKCLQVKSPLRIEDTGDGIILKTDLYNLRATRGSGVSLVGSNAVKRLSAAPYIKIEEFESEVHISAPSLLEDIEFLKREIHDMKSKMDKILKLEAFFKS
tara:strand:- start:3902 stop:5662 length:1761 start_codon:yes stop_codon:yes gene_type:complete